MLFHYFFRIFHREISDIQHFSQGYYKEIHVFPQKTHVFHDVSSVFSNFPPGNQWFSAIFLRFSIEHGSNLPTHPSVSCRKTIGKFGNLRALLQFLQLLQLSNTAVPFTVLHHIGSTTLTVGSSGASLTVVPQLICPSVCLSGTRTKAKNWKSARGIRDAK